MTVVVRAGPAITSSLLIALFASACDGPKPAAPPPCEQECRDSIAIRAMRETIKLVYNLTLQGKDVGAHDERGPCLKGGTARVFGTATSNAVQGTTDVELTYELDRCTYLQRDNEPKESFDTAITGSIEQSGTIAVQPGASTALIFKSSALTVTGTVYDPPASYEANGCALELAQNGNRLSGTLCGRTVSVEF